MAESTPQEPAQTSELRGVENSRLEPEKQERELTDFFQKQEQERQDLTLKEEFRTADAAEKARQAEALFTRQERETQERLRQQEARDREIAMHMERLREAFLREREQQREQLRQEIEAQRQRESQEQARGQGRRAKEPEVEKPDYADVVRAEALRNAYEQKEMRDAQQEAMKAVLARTEKMGPEEATAAREEMCKALEAKFKEQQEKLEREQQERGDRLALLYLGTPSGRER